jgi:NADH:ubiquinone oxidoreductase subunit F (NADH-binding)/(2Fe-2S) ferredoxin/NAD-dependent dihydropyrimidine dehydrogenase PreA subunit
VTTLKQTATIEDLAAHRAEIRRKRAEAETVIALCTGTGCQACGACDVAEAFAREIERRDLAGSVTLRRTGCQGFCEQGPVVIIEPSGVLYCHVTAEDAGAVVAQAAGHGDAIERLLYTDPVTGRKVLTQAEIPFYKAQQRTLLRMNRLVAPESIEDYLAIGGYESLVKVLEGMSPEDVIGEVTASGLRGRGGGGFPTGRKWASCRAATGSPKYVICNADEGDPGAYMDRSLLEGNPHLILEGMLIGAYAIGASQGFIYVRNEYPLAYRHSVIAAEQARALGLLGEDILGTGFSFDVRVARGAGAFVTGESTALMTALEGKVGEPRPKDVHTVEAGLHGKPSTLNNVETWANVPGIIRDGAEAFAAVGTEGSKGTKIMALTGRVRNTGLVEVAMGTSLREIVFDIGGGAWDGVGVKAVQTGGPSGGCLPVAMFDLPLDFEALSAAGTMVGSGGLVVMDERTCMVDVAHYFTRFLLDESCGKCVPCRLGLSRMFEVLTEIKEGRGRPEHIELLEDLCETIGEASLCALGKTAPNPVLSTLRYFRDEYEAHINGRHCPAGVCRSLITFGIDPGKCKGCGACLRACPHGAVAGERGQPHTIDPALCARCGICLDECRFEAVAVH